MPTVADLTEQEFAELKASMKEAAATAAARSARSARERRREDSPCP
jgi:hypothetical protein